MGSIRHRRKDVAGHALTFINEDQVQLALDYLRDSADEAAEARAHRIYVEEYRKSLKAMLMKESKAKAGIGQERDAYSQPRYLKHLEAIRDAVKADEKHRFLRVAAEAKISAWQTWSKNQRPGF